MEPFLHGRDAEPVDAEASEFAGNGERAVPIGVGLDDGQNIAPGWNAAANLIEIMAECGEIDARNGRGGCRLVGGIALSRR